MIPYLRIFFERSNGLVVVDQGPRTERTQAEKIEVEGKLQGEHNPDPNGKPRFWMVARNCFMKLHEGTIHVRSYGVAGGMVAMAGEHGHKCEACGESWVHDNANRGNAEAHKCPKCGTPQMKRSG